LTYNKAAIEQL